MWTKANALSSEGPVRFIKAVLTELKTHPSHSYFKETGVVNWAQVVLQWAESKQIWIQILTLPTNKVCKSRQLTVPQPQFLGL